MRHLPALIGIALLAACSEAEEEPALDETLAGVPVSAATPAAKARKVEIRNVLMEFAYSYPAQAAAIPGLKKWLDSDLDARQSELAVDAREASNEAKANGYDFRTYGDTTKWEVVTDLPGWLSLSARRWYYEGGVHGMPWAEGLVWDKANNAKLDPRELFVSAAALSAAVREPFCDVLDQQRAERRGAPVDRTSGDNFDECIDPVESAVILGSSDRQHFNRLGVLVEPYAAGPYAEGFYEVTLPVTPQMLAAVKPEYRKFFAVKR